MYFVFSGSINCDNCDGNHPTHTIRTCQTEFQVLELHKEFVANLRDDDEHVYFKVIEGTERYIEPVKVETQFKLK